MTGYNPTDTIKKAEDAINNAEHRDELVEEWLKGLDISPAVAEALFGDPMVSRHFGQAAEKELVEEVNRQRRNALVDQPAKAEGTKRSTRPAIMRGMMI